MLHNSDLLQKTLATVALLEEPLFKNSTSKNDILTPWSVVEKHMTDIFGYIEDIVFTEDSKILEIGAYNGYYAVYCAKKIFEKTGKPYEKILKENIFIATRKVFSEYYIQKILGKDLECNLATFNILENDVNLLTGPLWGLGENELKFTAIVGNPPYQKDDINTSFKPIYNIFIENSVSLSPKYVSFVIPARWYSGGKGLDSFREKMLSVYNITKLVDYRDPSLLFSEVEIKGGICYFLINSTVKKGLCAITNIDSQNNNSVVRPLLLDGMTTLIRENSQVDLVLKIKELANNNFFDKLVFPTNIYGIPTNYEKQEYSYLDDLPLAYCKDFSCKIPFADVKKNRNLLDKYKVFISESYNGGESIPHQIINKPFLGKPGTCCSGTFIQIGSFDLESEALNAISYMKTKLFRFMVSQKKISQHASQNVYSLVPMLDLSQDWSDNKVYKHFNLSLDEISLINDSIKEL